MLNLTISIIRQVISLGFLLRKLISDLEIYVLFHNVLHHASDLLAEFVRDLFLRLRLEELLSATKERLQAHSPDSIDLGLSALDLLVYFVDAVVELVDGGCFRLGSGRDAGPIEG